MSNHTPEPWSKNAISPTVYDGDGIAILRCEGRTLIAENEANARRIVACVNACRGLPTKEIEENGLVSAVGHELLDLDAQLAAVTAQRDELLAAISKCLSESNACVGGIVELSAQLGKIRAISNAAIAKCEVQNEDN